MKIDYADYYINEAVITLKKYKDNWEEFLKIDSINNIHKGRSIFNNDKKIETLKYLEIEHEIFKLYKNLYHTILVQNNKDLILECVYYTHKINQKLIFYENTNMNNLVP